MAHGFLTPTPVSGDNFWQNAKWLRDKLNDIRKAKIWPLSSKKLVNAHVSELQNLLGSGKPGTPPIASQTKMLGAGASGGLVGKNPTNIDVNAGQRPESGPRLPGSSGGPSPGGGFVNIPGIASAGLNAENFFQKAQTGVGASGEYLTKAQRIADFRKSQEMRSASAAAPSISPDSGVDIVAAVNRNTQMIVSLVEAVKTQTKNDSNLVEKQIQGQETLMLRAAARDKEAALEQGSDLSGFMRPEIFKKIEKNVSGKDGEGGGGGIGGGLLGAAGGLIGGAARGAAKKKMVQAGIRQGIRGGPGSAAKAGGAAAGAAKGGGGLLKGAGRLVKGAGPLGILAAGLEFGGRKAEGQTTLQAGVGTAASTLGGMAGAAQGAAMGAALGSVVPGLGTVVGGVLGGLVGGFGGSMLAGGAADAVTGANRGRFAKGGVITKPTVSLMGEDNKAEGVFPLEGKQGEKTFRMFGEGIFQAQKDNDKDFAKLQSMGLKQYYEREGGFKKMGEGLKGFFATLAGGIASLLGGNANAATLDGAGDYLGGGDFSGSSGQDQAMNYFMSQGLTKEQAAGIVGNLMQESTAAIDPMANNGTHRGIAQWDANRWGQFEKFAKQKGLDVNTREAQLQWIMEEMRTGSGGLGIERFKKTKTAAEAAGLFVKDFERSGEKPGHAGYDARIRNANTLATRQISGGGGPGRGGGSSSALANAAARLKGMTTKDAPDGGENGCVWAVNKVYKAAGITPPWGSSVYVPDAEKKMVGSGYQQVGYGQRQPGDVMVMYDRQSPPQAHIGVVLPNGNILSNSSSKAKFAWEASPEEYNRYYGGQGKIYRMPGGASASTIAKNRGNQSPGAAPAQPLSTNGNPNAMSSIFQRPTTNKPAAAAAVKATPSPLFNMSAANANTGTNMMATSQQVAMASAGSGAAPTVINNYYTAAGGAGGGVNSNNVGPGIGIESTGLPFLSQLSLAARA